MAVGGEVDILPREQEDVRPGSRFGPEDDIYEVGEEVGSGAAARVYTCKRLRTGEQLAVKVINLQRLRLMGDVDAQMLKLNREVKILQGLRHDKMVNLSIVHRTDNYCFLVMELVRGGELFYQIVTHKGLSELEARYVFRQLLEAIGYMHSMRVIHRDLKPENILIVRSLPAAPPMTGNLHDIKIADFGLSKFITDGTSFARTFVGTPQYWAPEVLNAQGGESLYDQSADFWSLGAVLFVTLCGRYPFVGKKQPLEEQIRTAGYNMNTQRWQSISEEAKNLVRGLMQVNPHERLNLEGCIKHPWVLGHASLQSMPAPLPVNALPAPQIEGTLSKQNSGPTVMEVTESQGEDSPTKAIHPASVSQEPSVTSVRSNSGGGDNAYVQAGPPVLKTPDVTQPGVPSGRRTKDEVPSIQIGGAKGSDMEQETIFCLHELLVLQVSIAGSLEMASLAFRHSDKELSEAIRACFRQARELSQHASSIISKYAQVAHQVAEVVLPDLNLAVEEKEPALAVDLLSMTKAWVVEMKAEGLDMQHRYAQLSNAVHTLIVRAQQTKTKVDRNLAEAMHAIEVEASPGSPRGQRLAIGGDVEPMTVEEDLEMTPPRNPAAALGPELTAPVTPVVGGGIGASLKGTICLNGFTRQLFEQLNELSSASKSSIDVPMIGNDGITASPADTVMTELDAEAWKRDVLDLLFMAPGVVPTSLPKLDKFNFTSAFDTMNVDSSEKISRVVEGSLPEAQITSEAIVQYKMPAESAKSAAQSATNTSGALLRALRELKRVDEILQGCSAFWQNMDGTVQKLAQMKEHTECLVSFAANSARLRERFTQRLAEYTSFWSSLERLCRQYVVDHQAASKRMYQCIREAAEISDIFDTAEHARMGVMASAMRERCR